MINALAQDENLLSLLEQTFEDVKMSLIKKHGEGNILKTN